MTFEQYWNILIKQWMVILICFLAVGLGACITSKLMTPLYQSTAVVEIAIHPGENRAEYIGLLASGQLVQTEAQLATGYTVLHEVASHQKGLTIERLLKETSSTPTLYTQLFQITVLDPSPNQAAVLANDIAMTLIKQQLQAVQQDNSRSQQQIQQDLATTRQQIDLTISKIANLQAKRGSQVQLSVLKTQLNGLQQHYSQWQTALAQLELTDAENGIFLRMAQAAQPAPLPARPNVLLNTGVGLLTGLSLGLLLIILFEQLDTRVRTPEALTKLLGWPVLATVWHTSTSSRAGIINPQRHDTSIESYRILRTNVGFSAIDKPLHSLLVTGATPGDGKSTVAANLAITLAKAGKKTLLVDTDLRHPVQHLLFNLAAEKKGLSNALLALSMSGVASSSISGQLAPFHSPVPSLDTPGTSNFFLEQFIHSVDIPNLQVMPSGPLPPDPSELLDSKAMQHLLTVFASYGVEAVIFDAPSIQSLFEANILASKVHGTLVVVDINRAKKASLKQVKTLLTQAGAIVVGCVVNKQRHSRHNSSYSYNYSYRYDNQGDEGNDNAKGMDSSVNLANGFDATKNTVKSANLENRNSGRGRNGR